MKKWGFEVRHVPFYIAVLDGGSGLEAIKYVLHPEFLSKKSHGSVAPGIEVHSSLEGNNNHRVSVLSFICLLQVASLSRDEDHRGTKTEFISTAGVLHSAAARFTVVSSTWLRP